MSTTDLIPLLIPSADFVQDDLGTYITLDAIRGNTTAFNELVGWRNSAFASDLSKIPLHPLIEIPIHVLSRKLFKVANRALAVGSLKQLTAIRKYLNLTDEEQEAVISTMPPHVVLSLGFIKQFGAKCHFYPVPELVAYWHDKCARFPISLLSGMMSVTVPMRTSNALACFS